MSPYDLAVFSGAVPPGLGWDAAVANGCGAPVEPLWSGLVPTAVGLYQIACRVPASAPAGDLEVILTQEGVPANRVTLPVAR